jgi:hypothetical protein
MYQLSRIKNPLSKYYFKCHIFNIKGTSSVILLVGFLSGLNCVLFTSLSSAQTQQPIDPSLQKPLPAEPASQPRAPLPNNKIGFILADSTPLKLKFKETITSKTAQENQSIEFEVSENVLLEGVIVIAKGSTAKGIIAEVKKARMLGRKGKLNILLKEVSLVTGERVTLKTTQKQGGGLSGGTIALSAIISPFFLLMGGKEAKYPAGTEFTAYVDGDYALEKARFKSDRLY